MPTRDPLDLQASLALLDLVVDARSLPSGSAPARTFLAQQADYFEYHHAQIAGRFVAEVRAFSQDAAPARWEAVRRAAAGMKLRLLEQLDRQVA